MSAESQAASEDALAREIAIEQAHVDRVYVHLEVATNSARNIANESRAKFTSDRTSWHREEDATALFERDAFSYQAAKRLAILDSEHEGLVFGRLDLLNHDIRYIGRIGVRDDDYEPLVIDWRAPAAEAFYRATPSNPMDVIRRRVLRCRNDLVVGIEDDLLDANAETDLVVIGEGALMASLSRARGPRMRDIVATIQAEQDEAIRAPYQGVTIISGGPGTGKTVVGLHRAAYLLYTHRTRLENGGVLVVGPSAVFMNYIERVLPGLGEDSVTLKSVGFVASDVLGFGSERNGEAEAATVKCSLKMLTLLRRVVDEPLYGDEAPRLRVVVKGEVLTVTPQELNRIRRTTLGNTKVNLGLPQTIKALLSLLWEKAVEAEIPEFPWDEFEEIVTSQPAWSRFLEVWWPPLHPEQVLARLGEPQLLPKLARDLLDSDEQAALLESFAHARGYVPDIGEPRPHWSISDIALLDELAFIIGPLPAETEVDVQLFLDATSELSEVVTLADRLSDRRGEEPEDPVITYAHVLVDESQDITPMQWRMLRRRGPQASWTLVGDMAQSSYPHDDEVQRAVRELIGNSPQRTFRLSTNYRSPSEVFELAAKVIRQIYPGADLPRAIRSTGIEPELLSIAPSELMVTLDEQLNRLAELTDGSLGVIVPPSLFDSTTDILAGAEFDALRSRVALITALQAKGLEYDAVIVVSPDDVVRETPNGVRVLYVDLTRPTQRLVTIDLTNGLPGAWREFLS